MTVSLTSITPADGAVNTEPCVPVRFLLENAASTPFSEDEGPTELALGTLTDVTSSTGGLRLTCVDALYSLQAAAAHPHVGREGACSTMPSGSAAWTVLAAVKAGGVAWRCLMSWGSTAGTNRYVWILYNNASVLVGHASASRSFSTAPYNLCDGSWHRVAVRHAAGWVSVFVDGVQVSTTQSLAFDLLVNAATSRITAFTDLYDMYPSPIGTYLDELQVLPYVSDDEIEYWDGSATVGLTENGPFHGHWPFNEGAGFVYNDTGPNGYNLLVLAGGTAPTWEAGSGWGEAEPIYEATGDRISPAIDVSSVGEFGDAEVTWTALTPTGTTVRVYAAAAAIGPWQEITSSGRRLTGVWVHGDAMAGQNLYLKYVLATSNTDVTPRLRSVSVRFVEQAPLAVSVVVNGCTFSVAAGTLHPYGWKDISGLAVVEDYAAVRYVSRGKHHSYDGEEKTIEVYYDATLVSSTTMSSLAESDWSSPGDAAWAARAPDQPRAEAAAYWNAWGFDPRAEAAAYYQVRVQQFAEADAYWYAATLVLNDATGALAIGVPYLDDASGSLAIEGYALDDASGSLAIQGPAINDATGSVCVSTVQIDDAAGSATVSVQQIHDAVGSCAVRGVVRGTVLHVRSIEPELKAALQAIGVVFR